MLFFPQSQSYNRLSSEDTKEEDRLKVEKVKVLQNIRSTYRKTSRSTPYSHTHLHTFPACTRVISFAFEQNTLSLNMITLQLPQPCCKLLGCFHTCGVLRRCKRGNCTLRPFGGGGLTLV